MQVSGGSLGNVKGLALQALLNGDRPGGMALQFALRALGEDAKVVSLEADAKKGILSFTAVGKGGTTISYRPGEGGEGVLYMTIDGKTLATKVNSDGSIEGITTGDISRVLAAKYGESVAQSWAQELAQTQKDAELLSQLTQEANRISTAQELTKFYEKVKRAMGERRTEMAREALQRIAKAIEDYLDKSRTVSIRNETGTREEDTVSSTKGVSAQAGGGVGGGSPGLGGGVNIKPYSYRASNTMGVQSYNIHSGSFERRTQKGQRTTESKEEAKTNTERESESQATSNSTSVGTSYSVKYGSVQELMQAVSKTLQFSKERLESYKQTLQAANSVELRTALLPAVFNQLKEEEAKKLMEQGMSREDAYAKAAMNALARLDDMIEKSPQQLFKYLNSVSGLPDAEEVKEKVEEETPKEGTVGKPPPELQKQIEGAQSKLNSKYSLNAFVANKKQAEGLAKRLAEITREKVDVIKTGKGYMVSVGGFQSEDLARGLAQGLGLKNYQVVKGEPQQQQPQPQQQPPTPAKK